MKGDEKRLWYIKETIRNGWSRNVLVHQIKSDLYTRSKSVSHNFKTSLPAPQSDLMLQIIKDPYNLEFLDVETDISERHLEKSLVDNLRHFLIELGAGFAFVGSQYHLSLEDEDYYIDLLFYHLKLRSYIVIEFKKGKFKPEYAGKLNFYINLVDGTLKHKEDQPTIGLLLCEGKKEVTVEYSLKGIEKPMGVSAYQLTSEVPDSMKDYLPSQKQLQETLKKQKK